MLLRIEMANASLENHVMIAMNEECGVSSDEMDEMTEDQAKECGDFFDEMEKDTKNQDNVNSTNTTVFFCQTSDCSGTCGLNHGDLSPEEKAEIKQFMNNLLQERMAWRTMILEVAQLPLSVPVRPEVVESPLPPSVPVRPEVVESSLVPVRPKIAQKPKHCHYFNNCSRLDCWYMHSDQRSPVSKFPTECNRNNCDRLNCGFRHPGQSPP